VAIGFGAVLLQRLAGGGATSSDTIVLVLLVVCAYNEAGSYVLGRAEGVPVTTVANVQIGLDTIALTTLLYCGGGLTSLGLLFFAAPFFVYGAALPLPHAFGHVAATLAQLAGLALAEHSGLVAPGAGAVLLQPGTASPHSLALTVVLASVVNALAAAMGRYLSTVIGAHAESGRSLAVERGTLVALYEQEAARLRMLLDIAQRSAVSRSLRELLGAVCETTAATTGVTRVEGFAWDTDEACLRLVAARGLVSEDVDRQDVRYPAELPLVARLRAGELVDFDAAPSMAMSYSRVGLRPKRAFAVPMVSDGSFEGALVVGYDGTANHAALTEMVQGIASQAALALANVRARVQQRDDAEVSGTLLQLSQSLSACLDGERVWRLALDSAHDTLGLPWTVACRFDAQDGTFELVGAHGLPEPVLASFAKARLRLDDSPVLREVLSRRKLVVADDSHLPVLLAQAGWRVGAWLVVPLFREGWVAGILAAGHADRGPGFERRQLVLAEGLGHHASIALQNARLVADLEAADRLKSEFVSRMSHELRTPVNLIIGHTEKLRDGAGTLTDEQRELVQRLDARGRELLELVEATLSVRQLPTGRDALNIGPVEFQELVRALEASTAGLPRPPAVTLEWQVPQEARGRIMTDRGKLALVMRNLVGNALKFTSEGRVVIRVTLRGDTLAIEVHDTGIGIDAEHLPHLFDLSRQVGRPASHTGVGFGLYMVQQLVARLGGTVEAVSTPGRGSRFTVLLPGAVRGGRRAA